MLQQHQMQQVYAYKYVEMEEELENKHCQEDVMMPMMMEMMAVSVVKLRDYLHV